MVAASDGGRRGGRPGASPRLQPRAAAADGTGRRSPSSDALLASPQRQALASPQRRAPAPPQLLAVCHPAGRAPPRQPARGGSPASACALEEELCEVLGVSLEDADLGVLREALRRVGHYKEMQQAGRRGSGAWRDVRRCSGCQGCFQPRLAFGFELGGQCEAHPFGNPVLLHDPRDAAARKGCVREFAARLRANPAFAKRVRRDLAGCLLACCCSSCSQPSGRRLCHGHVLFYIANCLECDFHAFLARGASAPPPPTRGGSLLAVRAARDPGLWASQPVQVVQGRGQAHER